jgi:hypothetical protein
MVMPNHLLMALSVLTCQEVEIARFKCTFTFATGAPIRPLNKPVIFSRLDMHGAWEVGEFNTCLCGSNTLAGE